MQKINLRGSCPRIIIIKSPHFIIGLYDLNSVGGRGVYSNDTTNFIDLTRVRIILDRENEFFIPKTFYPDK